MRQNQQLFNRMVNASSLKPELTLSKILAVIGATGIYAFTLFWVYAGFWLLFVSDGLVFFVKPLGLLCFALVWLLRPRFGKLPKKPLTRQTNPALYHLIDSVGRQLNAPSVDMVVFDTDFNASAARRGLSQKHVLYLGMPLWVTLSDEEKVALIAHELAHYVNKDFNHSFYVGTALESLHTLQYLFHPQRYRYASLETQFSNILMAMISGPIRLTEFIMRMLLLREARRAEYLADYLASTVSGTQAARSTLVKLEVFSTHFMRIIRGMRTGSKSKRTDIFQELRREALDQRPDELSEIDEEKYKETSWLGNTHPPMQFRMDFLQANPIDQPKVSLTAEESAAIDLELQPLRQKLHNQLLDEYRIERPIN